MSKTLNAHCIDDLRRLARMKLPKFAFDFIEGGAGQEQAKDRNEAAFRQMEITPRIGRAIPAPDLSVELFSQQYDAPFGIAPLGLCGLIHPKADVHIAMAAKEAKLPYIISSTASTSIEEIAEITGSVPWFQLYAPKCEDSLYKLINRVKVTGCKVMIITVDTAAPGKRLRDLKNGLKMPFRPTLAQIIDVARHPQWAFSRLTAKPVTFPNLPSPPDTQKDLPFSELMAWQTGGALDWQSLTKIRALWPHKLLLKGAFGSQDAQHAKSIGIDGIQISNHGGRQLDASPASLTMLQTMTGSALPTTRFVDSGIRSGEDVIKAITMGAHCAFLGRPFLYAHAAGGLEGVRHLIAMLKNEISATMKLTGVAAISQCPSELSAGSNQPKSF